MQTQQRTKSFSLAGLANEAQFSPRIPSNFEHRRYREVQRTVYGNTGQGGLIDPQGVNQIQITVQLRSAVLLEGDQERQDKGAEPAERIQGKEPVATVQNKARTWGVAGDRVGTEKAAGDCRVHFHYNGSCSRVGMKAVSTGHARIRHRGTA